MTKTESQVAGLEPRAFAPAHDPEIDSRRNNGFDGLAQIAMAFGVTVVEQLNFEAVARPVKLRGRARHTDRKRALVANRELDQHVWELAIRQIGKGHATPGADAPQKCQPQQLKRQ